MRRLSLVFMTSGAFWMALGPASLPAVAAIHECRDADGQIVYQDEPCLEAAPPPTAPKPAKASKPSKSSKASKPQRASKPVPVSKAPVLPWVPQPGQPVTRRLELPPARGPVDARWATPETTLRTFVAAVKSGDGELVLSCLTSEALAALGPDVTELPLQQLQETVASFTGYVEDGDLGPFWSIRALRPGMRPKWIFFERIGSGEWKISWI